MLHSFEISDIPFIPKCEKPLAFFRVCVVFFFDMILLLYTFSGLIVVCCHQLVEVLTRYLEPALLIIQIKKMNKWTIFCKNMDSKLALCRGQKMDNTKSNDYLMNNPKRSKYQLPKKTFFFTKGIVVLFETLDHQFLAASFHVLNNVFILFKILLLIVRELKPFQYNLIFII